MSFGSTPSSWAVCFSALVTAFDRVLDLALADNDEPGLPRSDEVAQLLRLRARHSLGQAPGDPADHATDLALVEDRRLKMTPIAAPAATPHQAPWRWPSRPHPHGPCRWRPW